MIQLENLSLRLSHRFEMIKLLAYEPPGQVLSIDSQILSRHIIGFGGTGCGKTSSMVMPILDQLLRVHKDDARRRPGILVLDPKGDAAHRVRTCAVEAGRLDDVIVLGPDGEAKYNLLGGFHRIDQLDHYTRRFLSGTNPLGPQNSYFTEARDGYVSSALALLLACGAPIDFGRSIDFMRSWWFGKDQETVERVLKFVKRVVASSKLTEDTGRRLKVALHDLDTWQTMDGRLRDSHRTSLLNALRPLLTPLAQRFLSGPGIPFLVRKILDGKILVLSVNAPAEPELAQLLTRLVAADFFEAVQTRINFDIECDRICVLCADEIQLAIENSWIEQLATIRSRGGAVIAATQSYGALADILGRRRCEALMCNFGSHFFFHTTEKDTQELASSVMGDREPPQRKNEWGGKVTFEEIFIRPGAPIVGPGALARLQQHHAYVHLADGTRTDQPLWLVPSFFPIPSEPIADPEEDDLARAVRVLRDSSYIQNKERTEAFADLLRGMLKRGRRLYLTPLIVDALCSLCVPGIAAEELVDSIDGLGAVRGVELLPAPWLAGFAGMCRRNKALLSAITAVSTMQGALLLHFASGISVRERSSFLLHERINLSLYPSVWRPAHRHHLIRLFAHRPELKGEFEKLTQ